MQQSLGLSNAIIRLAGYRWLIMLMTCVFGIVMFVKTSAEPEIYTAYARLLPPQTNNATANALLTQVGGEANLGAAALSLKSPSDLYASLFVSRTVREHVIQKFDLGKHYGINDQDDLYKEVKKRTKVEVGKDGIITLAYTDPNPKKAADIANSMIDAMYELARKLAVQENQRRTQFYDRILAEAKQALFDADKNLAKLEKQTGLTRLKGQEEASSAAHAELRGLIASREVELAKSLASMTERHPQVVALNTEIKALKQQLMGLEKNKTSGSQDKQIFVPFDGYVDAKDLIEPARREVDFKTKVVEQLIQVKSLSQVDETRDLSVIQILDDAIPPSQKSGPRVKLKTVLGAMVGFVFGLLLAMAWELAFTNQARRARWKKALKAIFRVSSKPVD